jgi:pSer/pThr/pTyr-binding forkhead associated (FHA) protein
MRKPAGEEGRLQTYLAGTLAGAGSLRCRTCGFHVSLRALDEVPECPNCGDEEFARASMFDTADPDGSPPTAGDQEAEWLDEIRETLETDGHYLVYKDASRVSVMPLTREWTKIGRSLTADIRLDDPTVSRRHALICQQDQGVRVLDDRSLNGIFLNGERTEWAELRDRDELMIGRYHLYFVDTGGEPSSSRERDRVTAA